MSKFSKEAAKKILANELAVEALLKQYPEYQEEVLKEIENLKKKYGDGVIRAVINKYTTDAKIANEKIYKSGFNSKTLDSFLPMIIKARLAFFLLENINVSIASKKISRKTRLKLWDGIILQRLLFKKGLERKPVKISLFKFFWPFIIDKKLLMPLLNEKGIYCFYTKELIGQLSKLIGDRKCLEIAAGDGTLSRFLTESGIDCLSTDDYSWKHYITYPDFVEKADAKDALKKYNPEAVVCSWPVPGNTYEKNVFMTDSVSLYIVIGTKNPQFAGNFDAYKKAEEFTMELNEELSALILPPSGENAVYIFRRK